MDSMTISEGWAWLLAAASAFLLICNAIERIAGIAKAARAPEQTQNEEIEQLRKDVDDIKQKLVQDKARLDDSQKANHITQEALLALLEHGLNGNNIEQMTAAKNKLHDYLINH
jgi:hypothetical protein